MCHYTKKTLYILLSLLFCLQSKSPSQYRSAAPQKNTALTPSAKTQIPPNYPQNDFIWPVRHKVRLSASFGELRPNHFHSGVDIRSSSGKTGDPLYASAEGYVSRIKIEPSGYGKALYINHPNGYTTVYGHMDRFTEEIEAFVKREQYKRKSFELDVYLPDTLFTFRQNQYIGRMGNKGRSSGPHLHFEIRDTQTEEVINPLAFGLPWHDTQPPSFYRLKIYELDENGRLLKSKTYTLYRKGNSWQTREYRIPVSASTLAFAVETADKQPSGNRNGISEIQLYVADSLFWSWQLSRFSFDNTRYVNAHQDYAERLLNGRRFHRCHRLPGNLLPSTYNGPSNGFLHLPKGQTEKITISVSDFNGNTSRLAFEVFAQKDPPGENKQIFNYILPWNEANLIEQNNIKIRLPASKDEKQGLYEDLYLQLRSSPDRSSEYYSNVYHIHKADVPLHRPMEISIRPLRPIPEELRNKAFIAYCQPNGTTVNCGGKWNGPFLTGSYDKLGDFAIQVDTTAPQIQILSFTYDMRGRKQMSFRVYDEHRTARHLPEIQWKAYIDGQWVLFEYDAKSKTLTHFFDQPFERGKHLLQLIVRDALGNKRIFEKSFLR